MTDLTTPARHVAVVGGYDAEPGTVAVAEEVGSLLAQRGCVVVTEAGAAWPRPPAGARC